MRGPEAAHCLVGECWLSKQAVGYVCRYLLVSCSTNLWKPWKQAGGCGCIRCTCWWVKEANSLYRWNWSAVLKTLRLILSLLVPPLSHPVKIIAYNPSSAKWAICPLIFTPKNTSQIMSNEGNPEQIWDVMHGLLFCDIFFLSLGLFKLFTFLTRGLTSLRGPGVLRWWDKSRSTLMAPHVCNIA